MLRISKCDKNAIRCCPTFWINNRKFLKLLFVIFVTWCFEMVQFECKVWKHLPPCSAYRESDKDGVSVERHTHRHNCLGSLWLPSLLLFCVCLSVCVFVMICRCQAFAVILHCSLASTAPASLAASSLCTLLPSFRFLLHANVFFFYSCAIYTWLSALGTTFFACTCSEVERERAT